MHESTADPLLRLTRRRTGSGLHHGAGACVIGRMSSGLPRVLAHCARSDVLSCPSGGRCIPETCSHSHTGPARNRQSGDKYITMSTTIRMWGHEKEPRCCLAALVHHGKGSESCYNVRPDVMKQPPNCKCLYLNTRQSPLFPLSY